MRVTIGFTGPPPAYRIFGTGSTEVTLQLAQTQSRPRRPDQRRRAPARCWACATARSARWPRSRCGWPRRCRSGSPPTRATSTSTSAPRRRARRRCAPPPPAAAAPVGPGDVVEVVPLKYADVGEVVGILVAGQTIPSNDTFAPQPSQLGQPANYGGSFGGGGGFSGAPVQQVAPNASFVNGLASQQSLGQKITDNIAIDRRLNAIILSGSPAVVAGLRATIAKIDVALPSVLFETQIVELTDTAAKAVGIDYTDSRRPARHRVAVSKSLNSAASRAQPAGPDLRRRLARRRAADRAAAGGRPERRLGLDPHRRRDPDRHHHHQLRLGDRLAAAGAVRAGRREPADPAAHQLRRLRHHPRVLRGLERDGLHPRLPADQPAHRDHRRDGARRRVVRHRRAGAGERAAQPEQDSRHRQPAADRRPVPQPHRVQGLDQPLHRRHAAHRAARGQRAPATPPLPSGTRKRKRGRPEGRPRSLQPRCGARGCRRARSPWRNRPRSCCRSRRARSTRRCCPRSRRGSRSRRCS